MSFPGWPRGTSKTEVNEHTPRQEDLQEEQCKEKRERERKIKREREKIRG